MNHIAISAQTYSVLQQHAAFDALKIDGPHEDSRYGLTLSSELYARIGTCCEQHNCSIEAAVMLAFSPGALSESEVRALV